MGKFEPKEKMVLIVDDEPDILELVTHILRREGFRTCTSRDGLRVNDIIKQQRVDLIIFDLMMPNVGGYEGIRNLQIQEVTRDIPVIVMTGRFMDKTLKETIEFEKNVKGFFEKPLKVNLFILRVHKILNTISSSQKIIKEFREKKEGKKKEEEKIFKKFLGEEEDEKQ